MTRFEPFNPEEWNGSQPPRRSVEDLVRLAREAGVIPDDISDNQLVVARIGPGGVELLTPDIDVRDGPWSEGDQLPHTTFDDPPYGKSADEWREKLIAAARHAPNLEAFQWAMRDSLGVDLTESHRVPDGMAMDACNEFAARIYGEYHDASPE